MERVNLCAGWIAVLLGLLVGAGIGMFFHRDEWLGGYASWPRRMLRLAHISLVGTGLLNLAFALSVAWLPGHPCPPAAAILFLVGAATMPLVCGLSSWRPAFRHLFFVPVLSLVIATAVFVFQGFLP